MLAENALCLGCQAKMPSRSRSAFLEAPTLKPRGVAMGVVSRVDECSRSLTAGEKCRGGGVSRESSFTTASVAAKADGAGGTSRSLWLSGHHCSRCRAGSGADGSVGELSTWERRGGICEGDR